ncbi:glycosyltransferase family 2 protein [Croceicoccus mobilis]|uniref:glycosyltransferase family 2 protein n=1 Tax=Croceicoccus mobilis TaxID=1703339 RepID=UPI000A61A323|nr:glycosyltransferase family A protein [Croceicoccus mobilis]
MSLERTAEFTTVINNYNYADYLRDAIESVLAQTEPVRLIVVDDGSTDHSREIIASYGDRLTPVLRENGGQVSACLAGLERVDTPYVHFLDADDRLLPDFAAKIRAALASSPTKVQCRMQSIDAGGARLPSVFPSFPDGYDSAAMLHDIAVWSVPISPPTSGNVFATALLAGLQSGYDYENAIDGVPLFLAPEMGEVVSIDEALVEYRVHGKNKHQQHKLSIEGIEREMTRTRNRLVHFADLSGRVDLAKQAETGGQMLEWEMLANVARGKRPSLSLVLSYIRALTASSQNAKRKLAFSAWALALFSLPDAKRRELAVSRQSSVNRSALLKRLFGSR